MVQELDNNRRIRQCNWVRFLVGTAPSSSSGPQPTGGEAKHKNMEANMTAMLLDGQPVFEATKSILPHTLIVVHFKDTLPSAACDGFLVYRGISVSQKDVLPNTTELQGNCNTFTGYSSYLLHVAASEISERCLTTKKSSGSFSRAMYLPPFLQFSPKFVETVNRDVLCSNCNPQKRNLRRKEYTQRNNSGALALSLRLDIQFVLYIAKSKRRKRAGV